MRPVNVDGESMKRLRAIVKSPTTAQRLARRARIVLRLSEGASGREIAKELGISPQSVTLWRKRFHAEGVDGLAERRRSGRRPQYDEAARQRIVVRAVRIDPPASCRVVAEEQGVSPSLVGRVWRAQGIKPHLIHTFKLSNDKRFEEKFWDITGLYLNPPERAVVLCCDEKSQCQALERTQPGLPLGLGHIRTRTHDYYRHGTINLFTALEYLTGRLIARTETRHRHQEWLRFLKQIDREYDADLAIHIILDNYATHKHPTVLKWLAKHPRFHLHFTPTSGSWLNLVERFFRDITEDVIRAGSFSCVRELTQDILQYLARRNQRPRRYVWKADPHEVLAKIARARERLQELLEIKDNYGTAH
jgi:transposase